MSKHLERVTIAERKDFVNYSLSSSLDSQESKDKRSHTSENFQRFNELITDGWSSRENYLECCSLKSLSILIFPWTVELALVYSGSIYLCILVLVSFGIAIPLMYTEIFIGRYARVTNCQLYRMAPLFFGLCFFIFLLNFVYNSFAVVKLSQIFVFMVTLLINPESLSSCKYDDGSCYDYRVNGSLKDDRCVPLSSHYGMKCDKAGIVRYPMMFHFWVMYNSPNNFRYPHSQLIVGIVLGWSVIMGATTKGIDALGTFVRYSAVCYHFMLTLILLLSVTKQGTLGFWSLLQFRQPKANFTNFILILFQILLKFGLLTPAGHIKFTSNAESDCLIIACQTILITTYNLVVFFSTSSVLAGAMGVNVKAVFTFGIAMYLTMIPELFSIMEIPNVYLITYCITLWIFEILKTALCVQFLILNFCDYFPRVKNYTSYVWNVACFFMLLLSISLSSNFIMKSVSSQTFMVYTSYTFGIFLTLETTMIYYVYGYQRLSSNIYFATGVKPLLAWRIVWILTPILGWVVTVYLGYLFLTNNLVTKLPHKQLIVQHVIWGSCLASMILSSLMFMALKCGKPNLCLYLVKPQYFWGPPNKFSRKNRKCFLPETAIRSQPYTYTKSKEVTRDSQSYDSMEIYSKIKMNKEEILNNTVFFNKIGIYGSSKNLSVEKTYKNYDYN